MKRLISVLMWFMITIPVGYAYDVPISFDLRDVDGHAYIGPVHNQGNCGSCWAFAGLAALESAYNRANGLYDDAAVDLSESFLVWSLSPLYDGLKGCNGGHSGDTLLALVEHGAPLEIDFPYTTTDPGDELHWDAPRIAAADGYLIPGNDYETIKRVIHAGSAVDISVNSRAIGAYTGGSSAEMPRGGQIMQSR